MNNATNPVTDVKGKLYGAENELRYFRDSISALRTGLEKVRFEKEDAIQFGSGSAQIRQRAAHGSRHQYRLYPPLPGRPQSIFRTINESDLMLQSPRNSRLSQNAPEYW
jgi:hypothetical protein